ncbi:fatty acid synthase isoform X2 [Patella vulgata]|uniref:fatty acid synthase isoform X2 n=1 Tax=Patella vulgata TaxID=6465 RepID=UPI00217F6908|nr:fatty acid synthase isoform X2 [Patella vulgata]
MECKGQGHSKGFIGGISCRFPQSDNIQEFWKNLESGKDMIGCTRWPPKLYSLPPRSGCIKDLSLFDAEFFGITSHQEADELNQLERILAEVTYESIVDSGLDLSHLQKDVVGYYLACTFSDADVVKTSQTLHANRLNHGSSVLSSVMSKFKFKGPACSIDTACSSSFSALHTACRDLEMGKCKYAIVAGANLIDNPNCSLKFHRLGMLSPTGTSNVFDKSANGYVRSDGVAAILISRREEDMKRIYASIDDIGVNCDGYKEEGIVYPSESSQANLLSSLYNKISVNDVAYVESHGTGTQAGDKIETTAIASVLCKSRKKPLLVGSVKSNMGHCEAAAGLAGLIKCLLSIHHGKIPGNLNFKTPNPAIDALNNGQVSVVDKTTPLPDGLIGINSFGFGGVNGHAILKPYKQDKTHKEHGMKIMLLSARTSAMLDKMKTFIKNNQNEHCLLRLISNSMIGCEKRYPVRGYITLDDMKGESSDELKKEKSLWLIFNIPLSHDCPKMFSEISKIFKEWKLEMPKDELLEKYMNEHKIHSQIAMSLVLVNAFKMCKMKVDGVAGSGLGEVVAAYMDGCLDIRQCLQIEEAILDSLKECQKVYPFYNLHIPVDQAYQLGPKVKVVSVYKDNGVIVMLTSDSQDKLHNILKLIHSKGGVYHYMGEYPPIFTSLYQEYTDKLHTKLETIITNPKRRTNSFLSASHQPAVNKNTMKCDVIDATYLTKVLTTPCNLHRCLQSLPSTVSVLDVCVDDSGHRFNPGKMRGLHCLLDTVGHLYISGFDVNVDKINKSCDHLPLDSKQPPISHLVGWDHSKKWQTINWHQYSAQEKDEKPEVYTFSVSSDYCAESLFIYHIWKAAMLKSEVEEEQSIKINITNGSPHIFFSASIQTASVNIMPGSKKFTITFSDCQENYQILSGSFDLVDDLELPRIPAYEADINQNVEKSDGSEDDIQRTDITWEDSWLEYLDSVVDFPVSLTNSDIVQVYIDAKQHWKEVNGCANIFTMYEPSSGICKSGGVALQFGITPTSKLRKENKIFSASYTDQVADSNVKELSINTLESGAVCLSYSGENLQKETTIGLMAIGEGQFRHQSVGLDSCLPNLRIFLPYIIASHYLHVKVHIKPEHSILFLLSNARIDEVNMVMIYLAMSMMCKVYVAILNDMMVEGDIKALVPDVTTLSLENLNSQIKKLTNGKGCDVCVSIPCSLSDQHIPLKTSIEWLADHGHFLLSKPIQHGRDIGMGEFLRNITLHVCEPIQAIIELADKSTDEMKELTLGLMTDGFAKLTSQLYSKYDPPVNQVFSFSVPLSLHKLMYVTEEPGVRIEDVMDGLSQADLSVIELLQDTLSFLPREYSLAQDTLESLAPDYKLNKATFLIDETTLTPNNLASTKSHLTPYPAIDEVDGDSKTVPSKIRIISLSGTPSNTSKHSACKQSTSTPIVTINIQLAADDLDQSAISLNYPPLEENWSSPKFASKRHPSLLASPAFTRIRGRSRKSSSVTSLGCPEVMKASPAKESEQKPRLGTPKVQYLDLPSTVDLLLVGPPRSPCTPEMKRGLISSKFEPTIIPLNTKKGKPLYIVHPIIGGVKILKPLAEKLNFACCGIQRTANTPTISINSVAGYYLNALEMMDPDGPYNIAGYSYGGMIALELALQLQAKGKTVKYLVMLDGSPNYVKAQIQFIYDRIPRSVITSVKSPIRKKGLITKALEGLSSTEERVEIAVNFLMGNVVVSPNPAKTKWLTAKHKLIKARHNDGLYCAAQEVIRISREEKARELISGAKMADKYKMKSHKFEGDIHLIRIKTDLEHAVNLGPDYGLGDVCTGKVMTKFCDGSHESFLAPDKVHAVADFLNASIKG